MEIDTGDIMKMVSAPPPPFVKGFVVIESALELDVVAVYTASQARTGPLQTFDIERVPARRVPLCGELVLPLHTGVANWQTVAPTPGTLGPVVVISGSVTGWGAPPAGASWVSQSTSDLTDASAITRTYELCFDLCSDFEAPAPFALQVLADNSAVVTLNGNAVGNVPGFQNIAPLTVNPSFLKPGRNCIQVAVTNAPGKGPNPTGFAVAGVLSVARGKCP